MAKKRKSRIPTKREAVKDENLAKKRCIKLLRTPKPIPTHIIKNFLEQEDSFVTDTVNLSPDELRNTFWETIDEFI